MNNPSDPTEPKSEKANNEVKVTAPATVAEFMVTFEAYKREQLRIQDDLNRRIYVLENRTDKYGS